MHKINAFILMFLLMFLLLGLTGCENKKSNNNKIAIENTTEIFVSEHEKQQANARFKLTKTNKKDTTTEYTNPATLVDEFTLKDMKTTRYTVNIANRYVTFSKNTKPIVLVSFFTTWCAPCIADIPYMNDLDKKYQKDVFISGVLIHDAIKKDPLARFFAKYDVKYFVSTGTQNNDFSSLVAKTLHLPKNFSIPLTVIYVKGKYFTHYEGSVPVEMIDYDIQQALKTLN